MIFFLAPTLMHYKVKIIIFITQIHKFQYFSYIFCGKNFSYCMEFEVTEVWPACEAPNSLDNSTVHLVKGNTVCVECQTLAMKKHLGSRCKGHGVYLKETRWKAVLTSGCHGKWVLKTRAEDCQCNAEAEQGFILL